MMNEKDIFREPLLLNDGIYYKDTNLNTTQIIQNFYKTDPFPNYKKKDNKSSILVTGDKNFVAKKIKAYY